MKQNRNDNAANRSSYVGEIYDKGSDIVKNDALAAMPEEWSELHRKGYIHIHDLDAYGKTYNCLTFDILSSFPYMLFNRLSDSGKIIRIFGYLKTLLEDMGNEQSGGMSFANFDNDLATIFTELKVELNEGNSLLLKECIGDFIIWCNNTHTRMGQTSYYITLNIGLANNDLAREIALDVIEEYENIGELIYKPNIVFKVCAGINRYEEDVNYYLLEKALLCTAKKMIPTYLLCDCEEDKNTSPDKLSVMGCRTRVVDDVFGCHGAIGRSNICNISINLPRLALEIAEDMPTEDNKAKFSVLYKKWENEAEIVKEILLDRYNKTLANSKEEFPTNVKRQMWCEKFGEPSEVMKHGTLSIGFIGLSETIEILLKQKFFNSKDAYALAIDFVAKMRNYCDGLRNKYKLNFSLLATSGELIGGRFTEIDNKLYPQYGYIFDKGFYTNSFHIAVDSGLPAREKIEKEGAFHTLCNGGSISYVELNEAPIGNAEGLKELIEVGVNAGVRYLGFNFPKDVCNNCLSGGVFDICPCCGSTVITHIRRVSGYLEVLDGFTKGKKNEVKARKSN